MKPFHQDLKPKHLKNGRSASGLKSSVHSSKVNDAKSPLNVNNHITSQPLNNFNDHYLSIE